MALFCVIKTKEVIGISRTVEENQRLSDARKKLGLRLVISWIIPLALVTSLRSYFGSDTTALTVAGVLPTIWTIVQWARQRRVDWIGVMGVLSFVGAFAASTLLGGGSLPYKLYRPVVTGVIGLAFQISVLIKRPLVLSLARSFTSQNSDCWI